MSIFVTRDFPGCHIVPNPGVSAPLLAIMFSSHRRISMVLYPHHAKANPSSNPSHDAHTRHMRRRCVRTAHNEPSRRASLAVRALDRVACNTAEARTDARGAGRRQGSPRVRTYGGRAAVPSRHDHGDGASTAAALEVSSARLVVGAALRDGPGAGALVGEARRDVGEAEVGVGHVADGRGGRGPEARGGGSRAHGARRAARRGVVGVECAPLPVCATDPSKGGSLVGAAARPRDTAVRLAGEELVDRVCGSEPAFYCGCGCLGWEKGLPLGGDCGEEDEEKGGGEEGE